MTVDTAYGGDSFVIVDAAARRLEHKMSLRLPHREEFRVHGPWAFAHGYMLARLSPLNGERIVATPQDTIWNY